jgi:tryptophan synthase alpha chain
MGSKVSADVSMPMVTMVSYAIIYRVGLEKYVDQAKAAGYAGAIVPDLLVEEAGEMSKVCRDADFSLVQLVTPTTPRDRQVRIAESSSGFLYYVSVTGITGERTELPSDLVDNVGWLREQTKLPICIGFGISGPETAAKLAPVADGLIVGSAVVRRVAESTDKADAVHVVTQFVQELRAAIDAAGSPIPRAS